MPAPTPSRASFDERALRVADALRTAGNTAYFAGGCVRDVLMGRPPKDIDVATDATPDQVLRLFPDTREIGKAFAVVQVLIGGQSFEVATFRSEGGYTDGRHPGHVAFSRPEEDARRRDFTINGLFFDPATDRVLDYVDGQRDLTQRIVRAIGDPHARFREDYLRMLRAVRFASTLEFQIDPATADAIRANAGAIERVSAERVQQELTRLLTESPRAGHGLELLRDTGLLGVILPEVSAMQGVEQPPEFHPEGDVFRHTVMMLDFLDHPTPELAYAVLLHDVGKPSTYRVTACEDDTTRIRFDGHAARGADMVVGMLQRLRLANDIIDIVEHCVRSHMRFIDVRKMRKSTLRHMVGAPTFPTELELHRLDCLASHRNLENHDFLVHFLDEVRNEPILPQPWVTGHDLKALGVAEGPVIGRWRQRMYDAQLERRFASREEALAWLKQELARPPSAGDAGAAR